MLPVVSSRPVAWEASGSLSVPFCRHGDAATVGEAATPLGCAGSDGSPTPPAAGVATITMATAVANAVFVRLLVVLGSTEADAVDVADAGTGVCVAAADRVVLPEFDGVDVMTAVRLLDAAALALCVPEMVAVPVDVVAGVRLADTVTLTDHRRVADSDGAAEVRPLLEACGGGSDASTSAGLAVGKMAPLGAGVGCGVMLGDQAARDVLDGRLDGVGVTVRVGAGFGLPADAVAGWRKARRR